MALNNFKCNHLIPVHFKALKLTSHSMYIVQVMLGHSQRNNQPMWNLSLMKVTSCCVSA